MDKVLVQHYKLMSFLSYEHLLLIAKQLSDPEAAMFFSHFMHHSYKSQNYVLVSFQTPRYTKYRIKILCCHHV